jgi:membrane associated rhomboid family serine protease
MLIPLRTSRELRRRPRVTGTLIVVNMLVHLLGLILAQRGIVSQDTIIEWGSLSRNDFHPWALITYQFLHDPGSIWHLAFNMVFLWVFGAAVEDRLGRVGFTAFYLLGGIAAGIAHMLWSPAPVIGASGAIAATTGAFAALAPRARVLVLVFFFLIMTLSIPALWFVAFYVAVDFLRSVGDILGSGQERVAYVAHLAGYAYGFGVSIALLATGLLPRDDFDIWFIFKQSRRRAAFRRVTKGSAGGPWDAPSADTGRRLAERAKKTEPAPPPDPELQAARQRIEALVDGHELEEAAAAYVELLKTRPKAAMSPERQLDIANQLHADGHDADAAAAYELFVERSPANPRAGEVRLLLTALYLRNLDRLDDARAMIERIRQSRVDADHVALLEVLEAEAEARAAGDDAS